MPILVTTTVSSDIWIYEQLAPTLAPLLKGAKGLRLHAVHGLGREFVITEIWDDPADHLAFFHEHLEPHLSDRVNVQIAELHMVVTRD